MVIPIYFMAVTAAAVLAGCGGGDRVDTKEITNQNPPPSPPQCPFTPSTQPQLIASIEPSPGRGFLTGGVNDSSLALLQLIDSKAKNSSIFTFSLKEKVNFPISEVSQGEEFSITENAAVFRKASPDFLSDGLWGHVLGKGEIQLLDAAQGHSNHDSPQIVPLDSGGYLLTFATAYNDAIGINVYLYRLGPNLEVLEKTQVMNTQGQVPDNYTSFPALSHNGRHLTFISQASNLGGSSSAGLARYVADVETEPTLKVKELKSIQEQLIPGSYHHSASVTDAGDIVFESEVSTGPDSHSPGLFSYSRESSQVTALSPHLEESLPVLSKDGKWLAFTQEAPLKAVLRNLKTGATYFLGESIPEYSHWNPQISPNGQWIVWIAGQTGYFPNRVYGMNLCNDED